MFKCSVLSVEISYTENFLLLQPSFSVAKNSIALNEVVFFHVCFRQSAYRCYSRDENWTGYRVSLAPIKLNEVFDYRLDRSQTLKNIRLSIGGATNAAHTRLPINIQKGEAGWRCRSWVQNGSDFLSSERKRERKRRRGKGGRYREEGGRGETSRSGIVRGVGYRERLEADAELVDVAAYVDDLPRERRRDDANGFWRHASLGLNVVLLASRVSILSFSN